MVLRIPYIYRGGKSIVFFRKRLLTGNKSMINGLFVNVLNKGFYGKAIGIKAETHDSAYT
jgi:hypothetical protein